ncbi:MAG: flagellar basal body P-ring protein FlgI, partial [Planctomycetota bacterium]
MSSKLTFAAVLAATVLPTAFLATPGCAPKADAPKLEARYDDLEVAEVPDYLAGTINGSVQIGGTGNLRVSGYGLVVNLEGTGRNDGIPTEVRNKILDDAIRNGFGSQLTEGRLGDINGATVLADPRTTVVRVEGIIPPGAREGARIDVDVQALDANTTPSLARGTLYLTELYEGIVTPQSPGERVNLVGMARGPLFVNPGYALDAPEDVKDNPAAVASLRQAAIQDGGLVRTSRRFVLRLTSPSYSQARAIEKRINYQFGEDVAAAQDEAIVYLQMPSSNTGYHRDW